MKFINKNELKINQTFFNFINDSTFIGNINTGQVIPPNVFTLQNKRKLKGDEE